MDTRWKSSGNPLYVRIIRKKDGIRHALLSNESGPQIYNGMNSNLSQRFPQISAIKTKFHLETGLAKTKLVVSQNAASGAAEIRAKSCQRRENAIQMGSFLTNSVTRIKPEIYFAESSENYRKCNSSKDDWLDRYLHNVTFADRMIEWLHSSNVFSQRLNNEVIKTKEKAKSERGNRLTTPRSLRKSLHYEKTVGSVIQGANIAEDNLSSVPRSLLTNQGRPQLHVYISMFEKKDILNFAYE